VTVAVITGDDHETSHFLNLFRRNQPKATYVGILCLKDVEKKTFDEIWVCGTFAGRMGGAELLRAARHVSRPDVTVRFY